MSDLWPTENPPPAPGDLVAPDPDTTARRLEVVRGAWGLAMLIAPERAMSAVGTGGDRTMVVVGRILGARHLTQAVLSGVRPSPETLAMGVWVDAVHALSALALAAVSPSRTAAGLADAVAATGWAVAGYHDLVTPRSVVPGHTRRRDALARRVLGLVPGGAPLARRAARERHRADTRDDAAGS